MGSFTRPDPPEGCRRIVIVGAGGFGREVLQWARDAWPGHAGKFAGFLSDDPRRLDGHSCDLPILGAHGGFTPRPGDGFLLGIGIPEVRRRVAEAMVAGGAEFLSLIHPTAILAATARIGSGSILCPYAIVSDSASVGRFTLLNYHASLGHDASAGDFAVLSPYATLGGGSRVDDEVFLGLHASVAPGKRIGARSKVSANSAALHDTPADSLVYGVPGHVSPRIPSAATP